MPSDDSDFSVECQAIAYCADRVHHWLDPLLRNSVAAERAYSFKGRLKSSDDIGKKVLGRRNHEDPSKRRPGYRPQSVTDASGFRIVKLFNAEVPQALDELLSLLKTELPPGPLNGRLKCVREIEFHTSRRVDDPLSIYRAVRRVVEKHGLTLKPPAQEAGHGTASSYSSVHVLLECEVGDKSNPLVCSSELQLRSVFEEAWGEISHRLKYTPTKVARAAGAAASDDDPLADFWLHLDALKSLTDGCAQYADLINRQIHNLTTARPDRAPTPLDPAERSAALFADYGAPMRESVGRAYRLRSAAVDARQAGRATAFHAAADAFRAAMEAFPTVSTADDQRLLDVLREELAFCSMFTENEELRSRAEKTYRELLATRPERVSVLLRLGQLRRDADDYVEAQKLMEAGLAAARSKPDPDAEVQRQASWLLRRDLAYVCWRQADLDPARADALALLRRAIELSEEALEYVKTDDQFLNTRQNFLYYLVDLWKRLPTEQRRQYAEVGRRLLAEIRPKVDLEQWSIEALDTVARAEMAFGERAQAEAAAKIVAQKLATRITATLKERNCSHTLAFESLSRDERDMYLHAQEVLAG